MKVSPSILAADFLNLGPQIELLNREADLIHLDIMDGTFVPNISYGFPVVEAVGGIARIPMDAHLMTVKPENWFERLSACGVKMVSFHLEASPRAVRSNIEKLHALGISAGVAINPDVPVKRLFPYIGYADFFLVMSVFAGFGGQKFIYTTIDRVAELRAEIERRGASADIEVDGGVDGGNAGPLGEAGATIIVAGSSVFKSEDPAATISSLRRA